MQRHRRSFHELGHAHELTFSCFRRFRFWRAKRIRQWLKDSKDSIDSARSRQSFLVWTYVFMSDHVPLLVLPMLTEVNMGSFLKFPVARRALQ